MSEEVYTIISERSDGKDTIIKQIAARGSSNVIHSWISFLIKERSLSKADKEKLLEERDYTKTVPMLEVLNIWYDSILLQGRVYGINIVQTDMQPTASMVFRGGLSAHSHGHNAYEQYKKEYLLLKNCDARNSKINTSRRRAEKWMRYWDVKERFVGYAHLLKDTESSSSLYSFVFEYGGGIYVSQRWLSDRYLGFILVAWVEKILKEVGGLEKPAKIIDNEADRLLLMERALDERYYPQAISGLVNVWSTYFTLSKGLGNLTIVKTCP